MEKLEFLPPSVAPAHKKLRELTISAGHNEDSLRVLLWLMNAHPTLHANAQVFQCIGDILRSEACSEQSLSWASDWKQLIPDWVVICDWLYNSSTLISAHASLSSFNEGARSKMDHPHLDHGATRHGIPAALWSQHEFRSMANEPNPDSKNATAEQRYLELQTHLLLAYMECRFRQSTQTFYEGYSGEEEKPVAPVRGSSVSPAVREFRYAKYAPILTQFPKSDSTEEFARKMEFFHLNDGDLEDARLRHDAKRYSMAIRNFFVRYLDLTTRGWKPRQTNRRGWSSERTGGKRTGFIPFSDVEGIFTPLPPPNINDKDFYAPTGQKTLVMSPGEDPEASSLPEDIGASPQESLEEILTLYSPEELRGRVLKLKYQRQAEEMAAQHFSFDYTNLTPVELRNIWESADNATKLYFRLGKAFDLHKAIAGFAIKLSLVFGQPISRNLELRVLWQNESRVSLEQAMLNTAAPTLVFQGPETNDWKTAQFIGLSLPTLVPDYRSNLCESLDDIDQPEASYFVLPDLFDIGPSLCRFFSANPPTSGHAFKIHETSLRTGVSSLLKNLKNERITVEKISNTLTSLAINSTGDLTLAWMLTADRSSENESRMYYTRHPIPKIQRTYARCSRRLRQRIGLVESIHIPITPRLADESAPSAGARFVVSKEFLCETISAMRKVLTDRYIDRNNNAAFIEYHNLFILYSLIYQSLWTAMRALSQPNEIYQSWVKRIMNGGKFPWVSIIDKSSIHQEKSRLAIINSDLEHQFEHLKTHLEYLGKEPRTALTLASRPTKENTPFFGLGPSFRAIPVTPTWVSDALEKFTGYPVPANFHRAFLRSELLARNAHAEAVDAFLGHFNSGESPFSGYSTFDYKRYAVTISKHLEGINRALGLKPVASRIIPYSERMKKQ